MSDIDPLAYATQFQFPAADNTVITVSAMATPGKWMIMRETPTPPSMPLQVLTCDGVWISASDLNPTDPHDVALVGFDRDQAISTAYQHASRV
ncbi:hypothetical protein AB0395_21905 [Streptosporangium sp. NPDC051023]|uniref:hypothetical protein n=1 Tax=Streptosporangium sp. NPDC051023 TaxID=3155410 RepID=UPI00344C3B14